MPHTWLRCPCCCQICFFLILSHLASIHSLASVSMSSLKILLCMDALAPKPSGSSMRGQGRLTGALASDQEHSKIKRLFRCLLWSPCFLAGSIKCNLKIFKCSKFWQTHEAMHVPPHSGYGIISSPHEISSWPFTVFLNPNPSWPGPWLNDFCYIFPRISYKWNCTFCSLLCQKYRLIRII